ncbi:LysR family transcriptional regulator [Pseudomonas fluorescens ABAC62]|nr:LysR family transcriptional regulator [Pseudomonas fluorescens ABAC62]
MNITQVDLNLLKTFEALHDESSASRAALRLGVTQSAISAGLRRLREVYGDPLFIRTGRGLAPTLRANQLKPVISEALDRCRQSLAMVNPDTPHYQGRSVVLGLSDDFEIAYGRRLMQEIARGLPKLRVIFRQTHSQIVANGLLDRSLDLAITAGGFAQNRLSRQVLAEGDYRCLVDPASLVADQTGISLDEFVAREHVLVSSGGFIGITDEGLAAQGLSRQVCASTSHFAALPFLIKGSNAVATIPGHAAHAIAEMTGLRMLACPLALPRYPVELGWRTQVQLDPMLRKVREAIAASFTSPLPSVC